MYSRTAQYYDLIYGFKDYSAEAEKITALIREELPTANTILDVACGTAEHAKLLSEQFEVDGIDLEPAFVKIAREKVPSGNFWLADMSNFSLPKTYDVVLCLFSSIGYLPTKEKVVAALGSFKKHLNPGGVIFVEPWITPENWEVGHTTMVTAESNDLKICRMNVAERVANRSVLNFHYFIATKRGVEHLEELHELVLYTKEEMMGCFARASLEVSYDERLFDRGLYTAFGSSGREQPSENDDLPGREENI